MLLLDYNAYMHFVNGTAAIIGVICSIYIFAYHTKKFNSFPKTIRILVVYCCLFMGTLLSLFGIGFSAIAIYTNNTKPVIHHFFRVCVFTISQQLRFSYIVIVLDRTAATILLDKYSKYSTHSNFFVIFIFLSFITHLPISLPVIIGYFNGLNSGTENIVWTAFIMHLSTLISCRILQYKNQKMYKLLAYQVTLQQRHQIVENIKILRTLWPLILVFSTVSPIGPVATLIQYVFVKSMGPVGMFFSTYNFTAIIMAGYYYFGAHKRGCVIPSSNRIRHDNKLVVSPLGKILPTHVTQDNYFKDLKSQWN